MFEYQKIVHHLREGCSIRRMAQDRIAGRDKIREVMRVAKLQGWLNKETPLPTVEMLSQHFTKKTSKISSSLEPFYGWIEQQVLQGIKASTIHRYLVQHKGFRGSYDGVNSS